MSITVIISPEIVAPIGNEMLLQLQTDNLVSVAGIAAVLTLTFTGIDTAPGHMMAISYGDINISFYLAATPDDSGTQIRTATGGQPMDYWMLNFAEDLMRNYYLKRDFDCVVSTGDHSIMLTAKETGVDYTVSVDFINITNIVNSEVAGVDPLQRENFELVCLTDIQEGNAWINLSEDRITPDDSGNAAFDLHDLFCPELLAEHTWPEEPGTYHARRLNHIKKYRLYYAELYEGSIKRLTASPGALYAILGGFDYKMMAALNGVAYTFPDFITTQKAFLTWQPASKIINRTQPEKLYFLVNNDIHTIELHAKIYFTDNTDSGDQELVTITGADQYQVYEFMVGYSQIDFSKWPEKTVEKYEIWLEDNAGNVQSHTRTFIIDTKTYRHERIFLFRNSFGSMDTFRATGRKTQLNEYERLMLETSDKDFSLQEVYQVLENQTFSINSGWITRETKNWLRELFLSKVEAYEIVDGYKFPIIITNDKNELFDDDTYLYDVKLDYKYAFRDPYFSGEILTQALLAEDGQILQSEDGQSLYA